MRVVEFKSTKENYEKEMFGTKCNTFRKVDETDDRFKSLRTGEAQFVIIRNAENETNYFLRRISDYTEYEGYGIISWNQVENRLNVFDTMADEHAL